VSTGWVHLYHLYLTNVARSAAKIAYPAAYADYAKSKEDPKAYTFNCAQRAHANYTENLTPFVLDLAVAGLRFPIVAASLGLVWSVARVVYAWGYVNVGPQGRHT
jgi:glutathione S-transferase